MKIFKNILYFGMVLIFGCNKNISNTKPNVLFVLVDDLGWADLGYTGSTFYETPNIDKLAANGAVFTNAYAACPVCSPSRAAIMTGKTPAKLNLTDYLPGNKSFGPHKDQKLTSHAFPPYLDLKEYTIAECFNNAGYKTMIAGKWHLAEDEKYYPQFQGFDINKGGNKTGHPAAGYFSPYKNPELIDGYEGEYLTDRLTDEVIQFIEQNKNQPFFTYLSFYTVHLPMQGKPDKVKKYQEKLKTITTADDGFVKNGKTWTKQQQNMPHYAAMVESMDENIGRVLETLKKLQLDDKTIVVFTSDNGGMATSNRTDNIPTSNLPLKAGKGYLYEGGIRVPLVIKYGQKFKGQVCDTPVSGIDYYPTLLDLANIEFPQNNEVEGLSLKPLLNNNEFEERPIFWHYPHYSGGLGGRPSGAVRMGAYKLIEFYEDMHCELYNINDDPKEQEDLASKNPDKVKELKTLLYEWRQNVDAHMPFSNPYFTN
ncbi:sulfatase [Aestuariibaculum sediminum]|uniref:Sulfatase n=1 Tax=Aestuariibaculum sediminum TaxID=2770637 RepID=A0A8J6U787_9FLAO|nr:sulfatase [Aestuariibaculum sediminum]MBD0831628.1 sulfatase [Aestuariibaculum sediminum]